MPQHQNLLALLWTLLVITSFTHAAIFSPFLSALEQAYFLQNSTGQELADRPDLVRRQDTATSCPTGYDSCSALGAPQYCCSSNQVCSADTAGYVACCPSGAACTGTITGVITGGTIGGSGTTTSGLVVAGSTTTTDGSQETTTTSDGLVLASVTTTSDGSAATGSGFVISGTSVAATVGSGGTRRAEMPFFASLIVRVVELIL